MNSELWEIEQLGSVLPAFVTWPSVEVASVTLPDIPLLKAQHNALTTVLDSAGRLVDQSWIIPRIALLLIARPSTASDPEHVVRWNPDMVSAPMLERAADRKIAGHDGLLELLVAAGVFSTKVQADKVVRMIHKAMLHRLVIDKQPVHLGFCQLFCVPFRENWREITLADDIKRCSTITSADSDGRQWLASYNIEERLGDYFSDPKLIAVDKSARLKWTIGVRLLSAFNTTVYKSELATRKRRGTGRNDYGDQIRRTIKRFQPIATLLYRQYLWQVSAHHIQWDSDFGSQYFRHCENRTENISCFDSAYSVRNNPTSISNEAKQSGVCDGQDIPGTPDDLPHMSTL